MADEVRREWFEKDYYQVLGVRQERLRRPRSRRPTASSRSSSTRTRTRATPTPRSGSRRSPRPTTCWATRRSASSYDQVREMGAGGFGGRAVAGGRRRAARLARRWRPRTRGADFDLGDLLGGCSVGAGGRPWRAAPARVRSAAPTSRPTSRCPFDDAMTGTTVPVKITGPAAVSHVSRHGRRSRARRRSTCPRCGGSGEVAREPRVLLDGAAVPRVPRDRADRSRRPARRAGAPGAERRTRTLQVKIPAGVKDGARIKLAGRGEPGPPGGQPGDLYVRVHVRPDQVFGRKGDDLTLELPITYPEAALGAQRRGAHDERPRHAEGAGRARRAGRRSGSRGKGAPQGRADTATCW